MLYWRPRWKQSAINSLLLFIFIWNFSFFYFHENLYRELLHVFRNKLFADYCLESGILQFLRNLPWFDFLRQCVNCNVFILFCFCGWLISLTFSSCMIYKHDFIALKVGVQCLENVCACDLTSVMNHTNLVFFDLFDSDALGSTKKKFLLLQTFISILYCINGFSHEIRFFL